MNARTCPLCAVPLVPEAYEGFPVLRCPNCAGHLLELTRYDSIRRIPGKTLAELEAEAQAGFAGDHRVMVRGRVWLELADNNFAVFAAWATALCVTLCVCNHLLLFLLHGVGFQPA